MKKLVCLNDVSDHGGKMITASGNFTANDVEGCIQGDMHQCPIKGHGTTPVTSTSSNQAEGKGFIRVGDKAGCGAILTTGSSNVESD
jgi:uncharacterized Zn-binding protein involved in type VI secretion